MLYAKKTFVYNFAFVLLIILVVFMVGKTKYYYIHIYKNFS